MTCQVSAFDVESVKRRREISDCVAAGDIERCLIFSQCSGSLSMPAHACRKNAAASLGSFTHTVSDVSIVLCCSAISLTEQLAPGTLEASPSVLLRLHIQIFIELVNHVLMLLGRAQRTSFAFQRRSSPVVTDILKTNACCLTP